MVDPDKAYKMCIAMGNSPADCNKKRNRAKAKPKKTSTSNKKPTGFYIN